MADWAIVIGVDKYWTPSACLSGAVRDALRMREWLLDTQGGGLSPYNLSLLLSPNDTAGVPHGLTRHPATQDSIVQTIHRIVERSGGEGDRLFFHYSGHGLSARTPFSDEDALVPEDFTPLFTHKVLGLRSILEYFGATQFREQFFFIDACRNIPWEGEFRIGEFPLVRRRDPSQPAIQQFVFYATSPGNKAAEDGLAGNEQGAFTQTLLDGLRGKGRAKAWDFMTGDYLVRVDRLFDYLVCEMEKKRVAVGGSDGAQVFQVPRLGGERGAVSGSNPVLARFPLDAINEESLEILVDPFQVESQAAVEVEREGTTVAQQAQIAQVPVRFTLPPREYIVHASALEFEPEQKRCPVELYDPLQITIKLVPRPAPALSSNQQASTSAAEPEPVLVREEKRDDPALQQAQSSEAMPALKPQPAEARVVRFRKAAKKAAKGRKKRRGREKPLDDRREQLQAAVRAGSYFIQKYGEFMSEADIAQLREVIAQVEAALESKDWAAGELMTLVLKNKLYNCGVASILLVSEWLVLIAPADMKQKIKQDAQVVRTEYAAGNMAAAQQHGEVIWQTARLLMWCLYGVSYKLQAGSEIPSADSLFGLIKQSQVVEEGALKKYLLALIKQRPIIKESFPNLIDLIKQDDAVARARAAESSARLAGITDISSAGSDPLSSRAHSQRRDTFEAAAYDRLTAKIDTLSKVLAERKLSGQELAKSAVIVMADDPLAPLEIASSAGEILKIGQGIISCDDLEAGFYRTRLLSPEALLTEKLIEFSDGIEIVSLRAPKLPQKGTIQEIIKGGKFMVRRDNTLEVEKTMSPIATAQVSTLLLLAGSAALHGEHRAHARRLRKLGVNSFRATQAGAQCGVQVLFGIESDVHGRADEYCLRLWRQDEAVPDSLERPLSFSQAEGLAEFARATQTGDHWLAVQLREHKPMVFSLKTLHGRLTMVVFHINSKGEARVFQYLLPLSPAGRFEPEMLRRLELIQRFYLCGRLDHAYGFAKDLLDSSENDPLAACLGGHLLLKMGRVEEVGRMARRLIESFNELSDGFVLMAEYEASRGRAGAAAGACLDALERGIPVLSDGLMRLFDSAQRYRINHSRADLLAHMVKSRARGVIWSAWSPELLMPGSFLSSFIASSAKV